MPLLQAESSSGASPQPCMFAAVKSRAMPDWRGWAPHVAVLLLSAALGVLITYPLIGQIRDHLVNRVDYHDPVCFAWNNWWIFHALVDLHSEPYLTSHLLVPFPLDLRLHTLGLFYGLASMPLVPLLGPITVVNLQILATPILNGYATFLLTRKWAGRADVGVVCGAALSIVPAVAFHLGAGRPSCAAIWPVALGMLFLIRLVEQPRWRNSFALAIGLIVLLATDQQMSIFGGLLFAGYLIGFALTRPCALFKRSLVRHGLIVLLLVAYPIRLLYIRPFLQTPGYGVPHPSEALHYSASIGFLLAQGGLWIFYGVVLPAGLVLAFAIARRDRRAIFGIVCAIGFVVLSLGPVVPGTNIPLPFGLLRHIGGLSMFRTPYRFMIPAALAMTLALAAALGRVMVRVPGARAPRAILVGVALLIVADAIAHRALYGFETRAVSIDPIYQTIARSSGDFLVLEVPFGVRSGSDVIGPLFGDRLMLNQVVHHKRMINGYLSRVPLVAFAYYRRSPAFMFLAGEKPPPGDVATDLDARLRDLEVGFVVVHPEMLDSARLADILALLRARADLEPVATDTATLAFRVRRALSPTAVPVP